MNEQLKYIFKRFGPSLTSNKILFAFLIFLSRIRRIMYKFVNVYIYFVDDPGMPAASLRKNWDVGVLMASIS